MNFIEQGFSDRLFLSSIVHPSSANEGEPRKSFQQFFESGMIIVAHEDRAMLRDALHIRTQLFRAFPVEVSHVQVFPRLNIGWVKVMKRAREGDIDRAVIC